MRATLKTTSVWLLLACLATTAAANDQMPWQPDLDTAKRVAAQTNRLVLIHFWAPWCRPCMRMEQDVFNKPETAKGLEANFVLVKLNADEAPGTARMYGVSSLPSDVITLPNGRLVSQLQSPPTANQYVQMMNRAAEGHRSIARRQSEGSASVQPPVEPPTGAAPVGPVAPESPANAPPAAAVAAASVPAQDPYADPYAMPAQPTGTGVTPAGAYGAPTAPSADPYAQPAAPASGYTASTAQPQPAAGAYAPPAAAPTNPYSAPPAADPYAAAQPPATPYAAPAAANPYAAPPAAANPSAAPPAAANPYAAQPAPANPYAAPPVAAQPPAASPTATANYAASAAFQPQVNLPQIPPGCPPLALDGNCPVTLVERKRWAVGHSSFGAVHRGRTYLFLGPQERDKFLADPDRFSPVLSGLDPVHVVDSQQSIPGKREFGVFGADGKIYLFADEASRARFEQNEQHYTAAANAPAGQPTYQAMRP